MVCELKILELERKLGRKLTKEEKDKVKYLMHHAESSEHKQEEEPIAA
jgi:hypothetical protein